MYAERHMTVAGRRAAAGTRMCLDDVYSRTLCLEPSRRGWSVQPVSVHRRWSGRDRVRSGCDADAVDNVLVRAEALANTAHHLYTVDTTGQSQTLVRPPRTPTLPALESSSLTRTVVQ